AFESGFKKGLNINLKPLELTTQQNEEVEALIEKYQSSEWTYRK
ncbi:octanoyltransferase, partial [Staphylococcus cohnii]